MLVVTHNTDGKLQNYGLDMKGFERTNVNMASWVIHAAKSASSVKHSRHLISGVSAGGSTGVVSLARGKR